MDTLKSRRPYLLELDVMRVILIIGVLLTHTQTTMENATDVDSVSRLIFNSTHLMLHFTRMGFVFITGLVLIWHYYQRSFNWLSFWGRRYLRIGVPYFVWISLYLVGILLIKQQSFANYGSRWLDTVLHGNQFYMYYLFMAAQLYLIFPLFCWLFERLGKYHTKILVASVVLQLVLVTVIKYVQPTQGNHPLLGIIFWHYGTDPLIYQLYFVLGAYCAVHYQRVTKWLDQYGHQLVGGAIVLSIMTIGLYQFNLQVLHFGHHQSESIHQPFMMLMDVIMILAVWWISRWYANSRQQLRSWLHYSGQVSFGIYLMQTIMLGVLAGVLRLTTWPSWVYLVVTPVAFSIVFVGTYLLVVLLDRSTMLRPLVGLEFSKTKRQFKSY
ncbi:acyltransferase [Paucilactobacillus kaifaensis]|uniref:acyltransferase n=1 Tax=Paucilactobacillus kaifaensis TaxID=2559921 RepID=UPI0010F5A131|nr:acyltransferase [Paucilactobacillus kaifaensis]